MSEESEVKQIELPPSSESLSVTAPSSSPAPSAEVSSSTTSTSTTITSSTSTSLTISPTTTCVVYPEQSSATTSSSAATSATVTSADDKPSTSTGLMVTRSAIVHNLRPHKKRSYRFLSRKPRSPKKAKFLQESGKSAQESPKEELKYTPIKPYCKPALPSAIKWRSPPRFPPTNDLIFLVCGGRHLSPTIKPEITLQPDSVESMDTTKPEASPGTKVNTSPAVVTRTSSRDPSVPTPTMKTRTSALVGGNGATNPNPAAPSTPTMKTRHSNRVTTPKALGSTTSLTVGGRVMSAPSTPVIPQSQDDSLIKRRSSSRSIKRKKFDDELVESSLVKSSRGGKVPPSPLTSQSTPSTTTHHQSPPVSKPQPEPPITPKPQATPPPPPPPQAVKEEVKVEEKKEKAQPKAVEATKVSPPPPPPKKPEVHVPKKPKVEPAVTPKPSKPTPSTSRHSRVETPRPAPEKKKGKAIPSKSSSSKSSRSKKSKSIVPLARETSRWTAEDDLALITAVHQTNDLEQVFQGVKFSHRFSMKEIEERWYALLYDPIASKASQTAMRLLHPDIKIAIMSQALYSEEEEKILGAINSSSQPTLDTFQDLINKNSTVFNPMRTPKGLHTHWMTMKQYHLLPDQTVQPMPRGDHVLNFSDAEDMMDDSQLQDPRDEILEHELAAFDRRQKRQIRHLENEIPKWQVLVENVTGMTSQEFDSQTLAVLRGRLVRYLMRSKEMTIGRSSKDNTIDVDLSLVSRKQGVIKLRNNGEFAGSTINITIGRSSKDNTIDVDLSLEGPAWKVSRKQGVIKLRNNGEFYLANEGKRAVHIDGKPVLKGQKWKLTNNSVVEIAGLRFIFLVNQDVINTLRTEPSSIK